MKVLNTVESSIAAFMVWLRWLIPGKPKLPRFSAGAIGTRIASVIRFGMLLACLLLGSQTALAFTISGTVYGNGTPMPTAAVKAVLSSDGLGAGQSTTDVNSVRFDSTEVDIGRQALPKPPDEIPKPLGILAFERGKFDLAYQELSKLRTKDSKVQFYLGAMSEQGLGTSKDPRAALRWYFRAAEAGSAQAQLALGKMFSSGVDLPKNYPQAATWLRRSAEQGLAESQLRLGLMYRNGMGQTQDIPLALAWIGLAADAGAEGADTAQQRILKLVVPADRARALELKLQLQTKIGMKSD
jgi:hypothetical protein